MQKYLFIMLAMVLTFGGCSSSSGGGSSAQQGLQKFQSCTALESYLLKNAQDQSRLVGLYGGTGGAPASGDNTSGGGSGSGEGNMPDPPEHSSTNVQEQGVDEPDTVKTDGNYIYTLGGTKFLVLKAWPAAEMSELARVELGGWPIGLFVHGDTVITFSQPTQGIGGAEAISPYPSAMLKASIFDVTDHANPVLLREVYLESSYIGARMVDGVVHLVTSSMDAYPVGIGGGGTEPPGTGGGGGSTGGGGGSTGGSDGTVVATAALADVFPARFDVQYTDTGAPTSTEEGVCLCEDVYFPPDPTGNSLVTVTSIDLSAPDAELRSVSVIGASGTIYGSSENLYLASMNSGVWVMFDRMDNSTATPDPASMIHRFSLGSAPAYEGSAEVPGYVLNQFSMGEYEGHLRVATTIEQWWSSGSQIKNGLYVLKLRSGGMDKVGQIAEGLGKPGERIYAVRFLGNKGYVVTFEQIDPLYTLDLAIPTAPRIVGQLEVPGVSTYLHPMDDTHLLAIGRNTETRGLDLSIFDISNFARPTLVQRESLTSGSYSQAEYDHKAFTYYAPLKALVVPVTFWNGEVTGGGGSTDDGTVTVRGAVSALPEMYNGAYVYSVDAAQGFTLLGDIEHTDFYEGGEYYYYPASINRSMFIGTEAAGHFVYTVSERGIKATEFADLTNDVASVALPAVDRYWPCADCVIPMQW